MDINIESILSKLSKPALMEWGTNIVFTLLIYLIGRIIVKWLVKIIRKLLLRAKMDMILVNFVCAIVNIALTVFVYIAVLSRLGVDTTSLVALLGAAGLAIGLALQGSLQNFAAGVMLIICRPFKLGDYVEAGGSQGIVEEISIFNTVLKTPDNRKVIIANGQVYGDTITNYSSEANRRIDFIFGIGYDDDLLKAKKILENIVTENELVLKTPAPVVAVAELADSSVNFYVRPWVKSTDYWKVHFAITEKVKLAFDAHGISIPFPQMDVHVDNAKKE